MRHSSSNTIVTRSAISRPLRGSPDCRGGRVGQMRSRCRPFAPPVRARPWRRPFPEAQTGWRDGADSGPSPGYGGAATVAPDPAFPHVGQLGSDDLEMPVHRGLWVEAMETARSEGTRADLKVCAGLAVERTEIELLVRPTRRRETATFGAASLAKLDPRGKVYPIGLERRHP
jgi:hypothetical protein